MPLKRLEEKYGNVDYSARSRADVSDVVVLDSLGELARVFGFSVVEYRLADYSLAYRFIDESQISHEDLQDMPTDLEKTSVDVCRKAADMVNRVCWRRKTRSTAPPEEVKGGSAALKEPKEFLSVGAFFLGHSSDKTASEDVFLVRALPLSLPCPFRPPH